jgi:hypothetical protein
MKTLNLIIALLFALFAAAQVNDPDPWRWLAIYVLVALVSALAAFGRYYLPLLYLGLLVSLIWMASLLPAFADWLKMGMPSITGSMKAEAAYIELAREFLGLLLCVLALAWHLYCAKPAFRNKLPD